MAYIVISRYTRKNASIKWHSEVDLEESIVNDYLTMLRPEFVNHRFRNITETNENNLEVEVVWESKEICEDFFSRPETVAMHAEIKKYNDSNNIVEHPKDKFEI
jgi:hypothetical protein